MTSRIAIAAAVVAALPSTARAAAPAGDPSFLGELLAILVPLALVIVALLVVLRLLRRRYGLAGADAPLSVLQILPLGPRERLVLVRARSGRVFTVGVGAQSVNFVTELDPADIQSADRSVTDGATPHIHTAERG